MRPPVVVSVIEPHMVNPALPAPDGISVVTADGLVSLAAALPGTEALVMWEFHGDWLQETWSSAETLRWIHIAGAGTDAVMFEELAASQVVVTNARGVMDAGVAEYAVALLLALIRRVPETVRLQAGRRWHHRSTGTLHGRHVVVIGPGSIGRRVAGLIGAFGATVVGVGTSDRAGDAEFAEIFGFRRIRQACEGASALVVTAPLNDTTAGLIDGDVLAAMAEGSVLVNVGRGPVVDESALLSAFDSGTIAAAALDVFAAEPLPDNHPFWERHNVLVSPHMAADVDGLTSALRQDWLVNVERWLAGAPLRNVLPDVGG
jgi:phosphoglycerate dehydrogenase-like enzyme